MNEYLIKFEEMPGWAQSEIVSYLGKNRGTNPCYVYLCENGEAHVGGVPDTSTRRRVIGRNGKGEKVTLDSMYYTSLTVATPSERAAYFGGKRWIPVDGAILTINKGYKVNRTTLYVHANGPYAKLADTQPDNELSDVQLAVLSMYAGLTAKYRKDEWYMARVPRKMIDEVTNELDRMGLVKVAKNGAVRVLTEGRQVYNANRKFDSRYQRQWPALVKEWRND